MCYWITNVSREKGVGGRRKGIQSNLCLRIKIQFINHLNAFGRTGSVAVAVKKKTAVELLSRCVDLQSEGVRQADVFILIGPQQGICRGKPF